MLGGVAIADNMSTDVCVANFCPAAAGIPGLPVPLKAATFKAAT